MNQFYLYEVALIQVGNGTLLVLWIVDVMQANSLLAIDNREVRHAG